MKHKRITIVGEAMLELAGRPDGGWSLGYGGDTLNSAIHLARLGCDVAYLTALGDDPFSDRLREEWAGEGLDLALTLRDPDRSTGLYAISLDAVGERSFAYWRSDSAARRMFALPQSEAAIERAAQCDALYFSLISLAILPPDGRTSLLDLAREVRRRGGIVAFDSNYRPRLWGDSSEAAAMRDAAIGCAAIGLPTLEDERAMSGERDAAAVAAHWRSLGCAETVVKLGEGGCLLPGGTIGEPGARLDPVDTSGAGDAFNAGYLGARLSGASEAQAAAAGNRLAGWTILRRGAIPARDASYPAD